MLRRVPISIYTIKYIVSIGDIIWENTRKIIAEKERVFQDIIQTISKKK